MPQNEISPDTIPASGNSVPDQTNTDRVWLVAGGHAGLWIGSYFLLNEAWYKDHPREGFHFFNDNREWNQVDKAGHIWTTYQLSRLSTRLWNWAGMEPAKSIWLGSISGIAYQSIIEIQDGYSTGWGFSMGDMVSNIAGAAAFASQELAWNEQRIQIKFSYYPADYPDNLSGRRNDLFGKGIANRILKDYNAQTYWISVNPASFIKREGFPKWLNIAIGYSSDLMLGGTENRWIENGQVFERNDISRIRRFYLSPDLDLTRINTRSKLVRSLLFMANSIKIPAPALEFNRNGFRFRALYF